jgi:hypothetical protein
MSIIANLVRREAEGSVEQARDVARYLTDGIRLFRRVGRERVAGGVVWLEDCWSLEILAATTDDLGSMRPVLPREDATAGDISHGEDASRVGGGEQ